MAYIFVFCLVLLSFHSFCLAVCPEGEFYPGPDCSMEPFCAPRGLFSLISQTREHSCFCWCQPGTFRNLLTRKCLLDCPKGTIGVEDI